jgi:hypothetical protein
MMEENKLPNTSIRVRAIAVFTSFVFALLRIALPQLREVGVHFIVRQDGRLSLKDFHYGIAAFLQPPFSLPSAFLPITESGQINVGRLHRADWIGLQLVMRSRATNGK